MKNQSKSMIGFSLFVLLLLLKTNQIKAGEVEDELEFNYIQGSKKGPSRWGYLKKEWSVCKDGKRQSPIDLSNVRIQIIPNPLRTDYKPANATLSNEGYDIKVEWDGDAGSLFINDTTYPLQQVHWHSPSEHTIHGRRYALELHMVHQNEHNNTAVIGVLYNIGRPDPFIAKLMRSLSALADEGVKKIPLGVVDPREINITSKRYYRYMGSFTAPPCTEGVVWTVNEEVRTVSIDQLKSLREPLDYSAKNNARPLQPRNNRDIDLYYAGDKSA